MRCSTQTPPPAAGCSSNEGTLLRWVADAWAEDACNQSPPLLPSCDGQIASCKANQGPALAAATLPLGRPGPLPACTQQGLSGLLLLLLLLCDLSQAAACCRAIQQLLPAVLTAVLLTSPPPSTRVGPDLTHYCLCNACLTPPLTPHSLYPQDLASSYDTNPFPPFHPQDLASSYDTTQAKAKASKVPAYLQNTNVGKVREERSKP